MKIPKRRFEASVPSMAMGDIAFLLLIFFVILAKAQDDSHIIWEPAADEKLEQAKNYKASVVIDVKNKTDRLPKPNWKVPWASSWEMPNLPNAPFC